MAVEKRKASPSLYLVHVVRLAAPSGPRCVSADSVICFVVMADGLHLYGYLAHSITATNNLIFPRQPITTKV